MATPDGRPVGTRGTMRWRGASWELRAYAGIVAGRRRFVYETVKGSEAFARRRLRALVERADAEADGRRAAGGRTVGNLLDVVAAQLAAHYSPRTVAVQRHILRRYLSPLQSIGLDELTVADVDRHYVDLVAGRVTGSPLSPGTVLRAHVVLRRALGMAQGWGWVEANVAAGATPPRARPPEPELPTPDAVQEAIGALRGDLFGLGFRIAVTTGLRRGELTGLRWGDIDLERGEAQVNRSVVIGEDETGREKVFVREAPKTSRSRRKVPLSRGVLEDVGAQHQSALEARRFFLASIPTSSYIFSDHERAEEPWSPQRFTARWLDLRAGLGMEKVRWHDLRHYVATQLLRRGVSIIDVAAQIGDDPRTVLAVYGHHAPPQSRHAEMLDGSS